MPEIQEEQYIKITLEILVKPSDKEEAKELLDQAVDTIHESTFVYKDEIKEEPVTGSFIDFPINVEDDEDEEEEG